MELDLERGVVRNVTKAKEYAVEPLPEFVMEIVRAGGLVPWVAARHGKKAS